MAERRRTWLLVLTAIALVLATCGTFIAYRFYEGLRWRAVISKIGSCNAQSEALRPTWLWKHLGSHAETFQPIVGIRLGSYVYDPKTRRNHEIETGSWLRRFATISTLQTLDLQSNTTITDDDLEVVAAASPPALEYLNLNRTNATDRSLEAIAALPSLKKLHISHTLVSEDGIDRLRIARPDMKIIADPLTRRGLGLLHRKVHIDGDAHVVQGFGVPRDLTVSEAESIGRIPDSIWLGFFSPVEDEVMRRLASHKNIDSVVFGVPFSAENVGAFAQTGSVKKLTVYADHLREEHLIDAVRTMASLEQLLILSQTAEIDLPLAITVRRPDLRVMVERPDHIGWRFNYRYSPQMSLHNESQPRGSD